MKAVMIYDNFDSATKAGATLQRAARYAGPGSQWDIKPWRLDVLRLAAAGEEALMEALDADLLVFAGPQACSMPTWLNQWLEIWASRRTVSDVALAAIRDEAGGKLPGHPRLSRFAAWHGLEVISKTQSARIREPAPFVLTSTPRALPLENDIPVPNHDAY